MSAEDTASVSEVGEGVAPIATTATNGDSSGNTDDAPLATGPTTQENGVTEVDAKMENNSAADTHKANNGNGNGNGIAETRSGNDKEPNGEASKSIEEEGAVKEEEGEDMEIEPPPKPDVMVDYTDEFGRVRTMLQR